LDRYHTTENILNTEKVGETKKVIVIFGGLGFVGHRLAESLADQNRVHVIDNCLLSKQIDRLNQQELERRYKRLKRKGVSVHLVDIFDDVDLEKLLLGEQIDTAILMAGTSSVESAYESDGFQGTVGITQKILTDLSDWGPQRLVYFSSSMVYGHFQTPRVAENHAKQPVDVYGSYKYASEVLINGWCKERDIISIVLRPTAIYGPGDIHKRVVSRFIHQARTTGSVTILGQGDNKLDFTYVDDVVSAAKATVEHSSSDEFNISFGQARSLNELLNLIQLVYPKADVLHNYNPSYTVANRGTLSSDKAMRILQYEPRYPLELGLIELLKAEDAGLELQTLSDLEPSYLVPLSQPDLYADDFEIVENTLQSGWLTTGPQNKIFEQEFLNYLAPIVPCRALSVNSCASALILALKAGCITGEVIVPAFTFSATANAVELAGATPRFVDIESYTLGIDANKLEASINDQTQAILVVPLAGVSCDIDSSLEIAERHKLFVIEDCAQALGAEFNGTKVGTFGDISCFSFFPTKMITTGEGGMLVTSNSKFFDSAKALANHGYNTSTMDREKNQKPWLREQVVSGYNFRMSNINAALGVAQMSRIEGIVSQRISSAQYLIKLIKNVCGLSVFEYHDRLSVYQALNILVCSEIDRDDFVLELRAVGIMASVHYPEILPSTPVFRKYSAANESYPVAEKIAQGIVTLPIFGAISTLQLDYMASKVKQIANTALGDRTVPR
jgi:perosamine synthetase